MQQPRLQRKNTQRSSGTLLYCITNTKAAPNGAAFVLGRASRYASCRIASSVTSSIPGFAPANSRRSSRHAEMTAAGQLDA